MAASLKRASDPPDAKMVMARLIVLKYVYVKGLATAPPEYVAKAKGTWSTDEWNNFIEQTRSQNRELIKRLQQSRLWDAMAVDEQRFMQADPTQVTQQMLADASWRVESILCLLWALGYIPEFPTYDEQADSDLPKKLPAESSAVLLEKAALRPHDLINNQRNAAELWHWRSRTRKLQESGHSFRLPNRMTIEEIVQKAAQKCAADRLIPSPIEGDFPAFGKPYRELTSQEYSTATSIAAERHFALNWLCGYAPANRWEDTPTDT
jgi:Domain of unknown function (DUF4272)